MKRITNTVLSKQLRARGSVLIVGLLLLLIITLVTLASVSIPATQLSLANNAALQSQSLAAAEDGLMRAESQLAEDYSTIPAFDWDSDAEDCLANHDPDNPGSPWCDANPEDSDEDTTTKREYRVEYVGPAGLEMGNGTLITDRYYFRAKGRGEHHTGQRDVESVIMTTDLTQD